MSDTIELFAKERTDIGKGASRRLRRSGEIPGILYGGGKKPISLTFIHKDLLKSLENEAIFSQLLTLHVDDKDEQVVIKDLQRHPYKPKVLHIDLLRVKATEKINIHVPLHFIGEEDAPGVKDGGTVARDMLEVEISCIAKDLPEFIEVDLSGLDLDQVIHLADLKMPQGAELVGMDNESTRALTVASIHRMHIAEEEPEVAAEEIPEEGAEAAEQPAEAAEAKPEDAASGDTAPEESKE